MRAARLKQVITEETKEKIREKLRGHTPWIKGKKHTAEAKRKISEASLRMWAKRKAK
jgi:hypothetical protein